MKIYVVDNGGQWTHREWRVLRDIGVETKIIPNDTPFEEIKDLDGLVLSGGAARIAWESSKLGNVGEYLDKAKFPILGMCLAHQFMAMHYGGSAGPAETPEFGKMQIEIRRNSPLFSGLPKKFIVWESHNDEIKNLPEQFEIVASSPSCSTQAIQHKKKPLFGLQFHPEVEDTQFGTEIFSNFVEICREFKKAKK
jgi:GMP synthase (glutamine-hydrolysing)